MAQFILRVPEHPPVEGDSVDALIEQGEDLAYATAQEWRQSKPAGFRNCQFTIQIASKCDDVDMGVVYRSMVDPDGMVVSIEHGPRQDKEVRTPRRSTLNFEAARPRNGALPVEE